MLAIINKKLRSLAEGQICLNPSHIGIIDAGRFA